jgi:hypothetical protein
MRRICDISRQTIALSQKKACFQHTKGHNFVINRWCTMPFGMHHPLIHIYTHTKFQWNPPKHFEDMALDTKVRTDGGKDGQTDNAKQYPSAFGGG